MTDVAPSKPYTPPSDPRLAHLKSYQQEAEFWDTHDFTDLSPISPDELRERRALEEARVEDRNGRDRLTEQLTVRLDRETYSRIVAAAREMGIGPTTLVRIWLRERLRTS